MIIVGVLPSEKHRGRVGYVFCFSKGETKEHKLFIRVNCRPGDGGRHSKKR